MGNLLAIVGIVLIVGYLLIRQHNVTRTRDTPTPRSGEDNIPKAWSCVGTTPKRGRDRDTTAAASNDRNKDRWAAIDWARRILRCKSRYVILDTETTGLNKTDEIVQLAVIDLDGNVLFNENIKPTKKKRMNREAVAAHGLTMKALSQCRTFAEFAGQLEQAMGNKTVIAYNGEFDGRMYVQTYRLAGGFLHRGDWECIMLEYAKYVGEWNDYYQNYTWQPLPGGTHSALGDCRATLELLQKMAATDS